ncbi:MAG: transposase [Bradyrhizobium sp.]|uniref:transposase n=1 Tax=Bradyrhizobium sp. TaxID=376 RepID=UPI001A20F139|nr:transposase [Bradyrhizobium sp.]
MHRDAEPQRGLPDESRRRIDRSITRRIALRRKQERCSHSAQRTTSLRRTDFSRRFRTVAACLGLTPRRFQSGDTNRAGRTSRAADATMRTLLYEAPRVVLRRCSRPSALQQWGRALFERSRSKLAMVAVARKLAVILHHMWRNETPFQWSGRTSIA